MASRSVMVPPHQQLSATLRRGVSTTSVEACTSKGCSFGPMTSARTQEAPPQGVITLVVNVDDARTVNARWTSPSAPNGFMYYEAMFTGLYYVAPENNNYNTISETRTLYNGTNADVFVSVSGLIPDSSYQVRVQGSNTPGSLLSEMQAIGMPPSYPDGVLPPSLYALSPTSIQSQWQEPGRNNAPGNPSFQLQYRLASNFGTEQDIFDNPTRVLTYIKSGLTAYTEYEFRVVAINNYGQTESDWTSQFTLEDGNSRESEEGRLQLTTLCIVSGPVDAPMATIINPQILLVTWEYPEQPNGVIMRIRVFQNDVLRVTIPGNVTAFEADDLSPYSNYYFKVEMCNSVGCTTSPNSQVYTTPQASPTGQSPPTLLSNTPTSIVITWRAPSSPNGPLIGYEIERRRQGTSSVTPVVSVGPNGPLNYMDRSPSIVPYTTYEYRIRVSNPSGSANSLWNDVTTRPAPPGGVAAPTIVILDHKSVNVIWEPPARSNGEIISYTIHMPDPRVHIGNPNITSYTVEGLVAYTQYSVTIEACTPGGCTESSPTLAQTDPYFPEGQAPPRGDPITQSYISVIWSPPSKPNGPGIRYDLHRMKVRQSLETGVIIGLGFWELIYQGTNIDYQDVGLTTFTTYQYRVTVYNNIGPTTSDPSEEVTTLAGIPRQSGSITAVVLDHISVQLNWTTPTLQELQGEVVAYYIDYRWDSDMSAWSIHQGLMLTSWMTWIQTLVMNLCRPSLMERIILVVQRICETLDGAPSGFDPPIIYVISPSAVRVAWKAPSQPNGEITKYSVYRDDVQITMLPPTVQSHVFSDLQPYTVYAMQVEVCTVYDCILSNITYTTTLEAPPAGISPPNLRVLGSQDMDINWAAPSQPNGIIQQYEVLRRAVVSCDNELGDPSDPDAEVCTYRECSITESICGTQCYSGNQVCCGGILHDYQSGYECCDTNYLPGRNSPSDVCCGGRFTPSLPNHECCQGQYVQVLAGQICCPDPGENRVAVGFGDVCCGGVPFENSGPQICCAGEFYGKNQGLCCRGDFVAFDAFHDGFNSKCCGGSVIESNQVCCEENGEGVGYEPDSDMECCGTDYIDPDVTLCCVNDAGSAKVHYYTNSAAKSSANEHCCGLQNIGPSQSCCNNIGYNPATHVCADRSTTAQGGKSGGGTLCPISQAPLHTVIAYILMNQRTAYEMCDFDPNTHTCGAIEGYHVTAPPTPAGNPGNRDGQCHSDYSVFMSEDPMLTVIKVCNNFGG
ncbi:usherin-like [Amphiura filiformis]|uniref:usherin-like n=1 Tax=Amphiura filiformis TaxID=82378 RepID=UPI003B21658D